MAEGFYGNWHSGVEVDRDTGRWRGFVAQPVRRAASTPTASLTVGRMRRLRPVICLRDFAARKSWPKAKDYLESSARLEASRRISTETNEFVNPHARSPRGGAGVEPTNRWATSACRF